MRKQLLSPEDVASEYGIPKSTQSKRRMAGTFCRFIKDGRSVWYRRNDLESWLDQNSRQSTLDSQRAA